MLIFNTSYQYLYVFGRIILKHPILLILPKKFGKKIAIQTTHWNFPSQYVGREHELHIGYVGSISFKLTSMQSHPSKFFQQRITSFHPLA